MSQASSADWRANRTTTATPPPIQRQLSVADIGHMSRLVDWLHGYISRPHPRIGRDGPVCPFVPRSIRADALRFVLHGEIDGTDPDQIVALLLAYRTTFLDSTPSSAVQRRHRSLVVVLPGVAVEHQLALDQVHRVAKDEIVRSGLMLGQFYQRCPETAARNPEFPVSTGPVPCFVLRHMAPHDVLFLHRHRHWFAEYHRRFAADYRAGKVSDPLMVTLFDQAAATLADDQHPPQPSPAGHPQPTDEQEEA